MRYCSIFDPIQLGRITLKHHFLMTKAIRLQHQDKQRDLHAGAWLNVQAKATKQQGKKTVPYFKSFNEFFKPTEEKPKVPEKQQETENQTRFKALILQANTT